MHRKIALLAILAIALLLPVTASAGQQHTLLSDSFSSARVGSCFADGQAIDANFIAEFNGYGSQCINGSGQFNQEPKAPIDAADTHSALAISNLSFAGSYTVAARVITIAQLRPQPNDWEVGWLLWNYSNTNTFYYLILKPQGWEVGKEWCNVAVTPCQSQQFLATGTAPSIPVGTSVTMTMGQVVHGGLPTFAIYYAIGNGPSTLLATVSDPGNVSMPYLSGRLGLYDEEASVAWKSIVVRA